MTMEVREYQTVEGKSPVKSGSRVSGIPPSGRESCRGWTVSKPGSLAIGGVSVKESANSGSTSVQGIGSITPRKARHSSSSCVGAISERKQRTSKELMRTGKTTKAASRSRPFRAAEYLRSDAEVAAYIEAMLEDGDPRAVPIALRTVVDAAGGMTALAQKTGLSRETLYRTLSKRGNPRLGTLAVILAAFGLRLTVRTRGGSTSGRVNLARA